MIYPDFKPGDLLRLKLRQARTWKFSYDDLMVNEPYDGELGYIYKNDIILILEEPRLIDQERHGLAKPFWEAKVLVREMSCWIVFQQSLTSCFVEKVTPQ